MELYLKLKELLFKQSTEALLPQNLLDDILNDFHKLRSDGIEGGNQSIESLNPLLFYVIMFRDYKKDFLSTIPFGLIVTNPDDAERNINFFHSNPDIAKKLVELTGNLSARFEMEIRRREHPWKVWPVTTKENILEPPGMMFNRNAINVVYKAQKEQAIKLYKSLKEEFGGGMLIILANETSAIRIDNIDYLTPEEKEFGGTAFFMCERDEGTRISVYVGDMGNIQTHLTPLQGMKLS